MGRDFAGSPSEKKLNAPRSSSNSVSRDPSDVSTKASMVNCEDCGAEVHNVEHSVAEECHEKQDILGLKSTNHNAALKTEVLNSNEKKLSTPVKGKAQSAPQVQTPTDTSPIGAKTFDICGNSSSNSNDLHSPSSAKKSQVKHQMAVKYISKLSKLAKRMKVCSQPDYATTINPYL